MLNDEGNENNHHPSLQTRWRVIGGGALLLAGLMAWNGAWFGFVLDSRLMTIAYWCVFLFLLLVSFLTVLLDIRYIRLQYVVAQRELLRETFQSDEIRKAVLDAQEKHRTEKE